MESNVMDNLYKILGVPETATTEELKSAYRKLAHQYHPDKPENQNDPETEEKFKQVGYAYRILNDPGSRLLYDRTGNPEAVPIDQQVKGVLVAALTDALANDAPKILEHARKFVQNAEARFEKQRLEYISERDKLKAKRNKIKTKSDTNIFHDLIDKVIDGIDTCLKQIDIDKEIAQGCYAVLDSYTSEEPEQITSISIEDVFGSTTDEAIKKALAEMWKEVDEKKRNQK